VSTTADRTAISVVVERVGSKFLPDTTGWTNRFHVRSETSSRLYVIAQRTGSGEWGCNCPGWRTSAARTNGVRTCKHLREIVPALTAATRGRGVGR
jgi:hypothetical protein